MIINENAVWLRDKFYIDDEAIQVGDYISDFSALFNSKKMTIKADKIIETKNPVAIRTIEHITQHEKLKSVVEKNNKVEIQKVCFRDVLYLCNKKYDICVLPKYLDFLIGFELFYDPKEQGIYCFDYQPAYKYAELDEAYDLVAFIKILDKKYCKKFIQKLKNLNKFYAEMEVEDETPKAIK